MNDNKILGVDPGQKVRHQEPPNRHGSSGAGLSFGRSIEVPRSRRKPETREIIPIPLSNSAQASWFRRNYQWLTSYYKKTTVNQCPNENFEGSGLPFHGRRNVERHYGSVQVNSGRAIYDTSDTSDADSPAAQKGRFAGFSRVSTINHNRARRYGEFNDRNVNRFQETSQIREVNYGKGCLNQKLLEIFKGFFIFNKPFPETLTNTEWLELLYFSSIYIDPCNLIPSRNVVEELIRTCPDINSYEKLIKICPASMVISDENIKKQWRFWEIACLSYHDMLAYLPEELKTENKGKYHSLCIAVISSNPDIISKIKSYPGIDELWRFVCKIYPNKIQLYKRDIGKKRFYQELCEIAIYNNHSKICVLRYIEWGYFDYKTQKELCETAIKRNPEELHHYNFPKILANFASNKEFALLACSINPDFYETCYYSGETKPMKDWQICKMCFLKKKDLISYIPERVLKDNFDDFSKYFINVLAAEGSSAIELLPEAFQEAYPEDYDHLLKNSKICKKVKFQSIERTDRDIKEQKRKADTTEKNDSNISSLIKGDIRLECFKKGQRTRELWLKACQQNPLSIQHVPEEFRGFVLRECPDTRWFCPGFATQEAKNRAVLLNKNTRINDLNCLRQKSEVSEIDKLIDFLNHPKADALLDIPGHHLYSADNPLNARIESPFLEQLLVACYQRQDFQPSEVSISEQLTDYIKQHQPGFQPCQKTEPLLIRQWEICGGRTLRIKSPDTKGQQDELLQHYKFQRKGEQPEALSREGLAYAFLRQSAEPGATPRSSFKSRWPEQYRFISVPVKALPGEIWPEFDDELEITVSPEGESCVNVYCYRASADYCRYAHTPDDNEHPYLRAETGLLNGLHDIGQLARRGILLTSVLPAFHDSFAKRRWFLFSSLICPDSSQPQNYAGVMPYLPGTFGAWNTVAIERPDFGYHGVRDIGDFEKFGEVQDIFDPRYTSATKHPRRVMQLLAMFEVLVGESLLAACLLYGRLHRGSRDYHYKNTRAVMDFQMFLENAANELITGFLPQRQQVDLQRLLDLNNEDYHKWRHRTALEFLYWTAEQPILEKLPKKQSSNNGEDRGAESCPAMDDRFLTEDCFSQHCSDRDGGLCEELYPVNSKSFYSTKATDYLNPFGRLNLGCTNRSFPLVSLVKGLTRMCTGILRLPATGLDAKDND